MRITKRQVHNDQEFELDSPCRIQCQHCGRWLKNSELDEGLCDGCLKRLGEPDKKGAFNDL